MASSSTQKGLEVPVSTPGADEAAASLDKVGDSLKKVGTAAGESSIKVGVGAKASADDLKKIGESAKKSEELLKDLKATGNAALQELAQKGAEFAKSFGGAGGDIAEIGVKIVSAFGVTGQVIGATVGVVGMLVQALDAEAAREQLVADKAEVLRDTNQRLGGSFNYVTQAINAAKTAEEARTIASRELLTILQQQLALVQQGRSAPQSEAQVRDVNVLSQAIARQQNVSREAALTLTQHALATGNLEEQQLLLGVSVQRAADPMQEQRRQALLLASALKTAAEREADHRREILSAARARREAAEEAQGMAPDNAAYEQATRDITAATAQETAAQNALTTALQGAANLAANQTALVAAQRNEIVSLTDAEKALANQRQRDAEKVRRMALPPGPSAAEVRASQDALRVAREANEVAGQTIDFERRHAAAMRVVITSLYEVEQAERALRQGRETVAERNALASALTTLTAAQDAATQVDRDAADAMQEKNVALRDQAIALDELEIAAQQSLRTGAEQLRQMEQQSRTSTQGLTRANRSLGAAQRRAADDPGGPNYTQALGLGSTERERLELQISLGNANSDVAEAQAEYNEVQAETSMGMGNAIDMQTRMGDATLRLANALTAQSDAQAAANAEVNKIKTDRVVALKDAAGGLAKGLVETGVAALIAGENVGKAMKAQLAASLAALAQESAVKALFALATGLFQIATGNYAAGGQSLISAATFAAVAVAAGAGAAALTPASAPAGAAGKGAAASSGGGEGQNNQPMPPIQINYYAPTFGGREGTDGEVGRRITRYQDTNAALRRNRS